MNKNFPLVCINIPTFNNENTIKQTLYSILNQTYKKIKIIIIDNGSTDNTLKKIKEIKNKKISIIKNKSKKGMYNLAKAYKSKQNYLCVYHSDDIYHKTIVQEQIKYLQKNKTTILVSTKAKIIDEVDNVIGKTNKNLNKFLFSNQYELIKVVLKEYNIINCPTVMINNKLLKSKKNIKWNIKKFSSSADLDFYFRLLNLGKIKILNKYLCSIRITKKQITNTERNKTSKSDFLKVIENYLNKKEIKNRLDHKDKKNLDILKYRDQIKIIYNHYKKKELNSLRIKLKKIKFFKFIKLFKISKRYFFTLFCIFYFKIRFNLNI